MFEYLGIDAFTALAFVWFGCAVGAVMIPIHLILQVRHDEEGFGWKEPVYASVALSFGFGVIVTVGGALEGAPSDAYLGNGFAITAALLPTTVIGGLLGRLIGWLLMRVHTPFQ